MYPPKTNNIDQHRKESLAETPRKFKNLSLNKMTKFINQTRQKIRTTYNISALEDLVKQAHNQKWANYLKNELQNHITTRKQYAAMGNDPHARLE